MSEKFNINSQLETIRNAYDKSVDDHNNGIDELDSLPEEFKKSPEFQKFQDVKHSCHSGAPDIREYLNPMPGMKFLDVGSCANLLGHKLHEWSSTYYGIDISKKLIEVTKNFVVCYNMNIGGLRVAEVTNIPFENEFFDITAVIGVLEYYDIGYIKKALRELKRVLTPQGRMVVDLPNLKHPDVNTMITFEQYLGRPRFYLPTRKQFEEELTKLFSIDKIDDALLMIKYFVRADK